MFNYQVSAVNGKSYSRPERSESVDIEARLGLEPIKGLEHRRRRLQRQAGQRRQDEQPGSAHRRAPQRLRRVLDHVQRRRRVFRRQQLEERDDRRRGLRQRLHGVRQLPSGQELEHLRPLRQRQSERRPRPNKEITYYNVGIEKQFNKVFTANFAYKHAETGGAVSTGNGSVGGGTNLNGDYDEVGFWFVYNF
ncbi:MAG: hypothetical protein R2862_08920 [Thermoanaerobaculia bacterium]